MSERHRMVRDVVKRGLGLFGYQLVRKPKFGSRYAKSVLYEQDDVFHDIRNAGLTRTRTLDGGLRSTEKLYNTTELFKAVRGMDGAVAECGSFKGLSSYVFCNFQRLWDPKFDGDDYHIFDSFEGLSAPSTEDHVMDERIGVVGRAVQPAGAFAGTLAEVKGALSAFPRITYHPGWIPESFVGVPERKYRFVHIDVDVYEPTKGAIEYFYPRLGGIL